MCYRGRKKKALTEAASEEVPQDADTLDEQPPQYNEPPAEQSSNNAPKGNSVGRKLVTPPKATHKPRLGNPLSSHKGGVKSFSLKDLTQQKQDDEVKESSEEKTAEPKHTDQELDFSQEALEAAWGKLTERMASRPRLYNTMISRKVVKSEDAKVYFTLDNKLQDEAIQEILPEIKFFLRGELKNKNLEINTEIKEAEQPENKKLFTAKEKYQHLLKKNSALEQLRQEFDLDIE